MTQQTVRVPFLDLPALHADLKAELMDVFSRALDGAAFIGGPEVAGFEAEFAAFTGAARCVGVGSGTDALRFALMAMGVGPGDLAVTVPNTFIATTEAISQAGADFAFVDVDSATCLMDPQRLADFLKLRCDKGKGPRPKAVVPVHLYGQTADMDAIGTLAGRYDLLVLEDAAQAHGAACRGRNAGTMGNAAAFSFYPGKNLGACGEGGAVTTGDPALADRVAVIRDHGQSEKYHHQVEGYNGRLDAVQAGALRVKLRRLAAWNDQRRHVAALYDAAFADMDAVRPVALGPGNTHVHHLYVIHVPDRDGLQAFLAGRGIQSGLHYPVPLHLQACYAGLGHARGDFPVAEASAASLLSLPMFPGMTDEQAGLVIEAVSEYGEKA